MSVLGDASVSTGAGTLSAGHEYYAYIGQYTGSGGPPTTVTLRLNTLSGTANVKVCVCTGSTSSAPDTYVSTTTPGAEGIVTATTTEQELTTGTLAGTSNISTNDHVFVGVLGENDFRTNNDASSGQTININFTTGYADGFDGGLGSLNSYGGDPIQSYEININDAAGSVLRGGLSLLGVGS